MSTRNLIKLFFFFLGYILPFSASLQPDIPFESDNNTTATYEQAVAFFEALGERSPLLAVRKHGATDSGQPLHLAILAADEAFTPLQARKQGKVVLFINNAIHPGEPCGVDATMMLFRDIISDPAKHDLLAHLVIVAIPFYNIGGGLNRGAFSRANQIGPAAHGFRGNAKNLDLNRDFIKCDSRNAQTFNQLFSYWQPHLFVDNHTSNGADYSYTLTMIATQQDKLHPSLSNYLESEMLPALYERMEKVGWEMTPYVNVRSTPDEGIYGFLDLPRYASGYAVLHNTISFIPEAHMLKPYKDRVYSTYAFMESMLYTIQEDYELILKAKAQAEGQVMAQDSFALNWELEPERFDSIVFKGYAAKYKKSEVSGLDRLYYDRSEPYEKKIPYYKYFRESLKVKKPVAYIIPQAYQDVIQRLQWNGVLLDRLSKDVKIPVEMSYIRDYQTTRFPYEGHYLHYDIELENTIMEQQYREGDVVVWVKQASNRYIVETLEPNAPDGFFAWNFFDGILMQKEYFSSYVFEDLAAELLKADPVLQEDLEKKRAEDEDFAQSARAQLDFIYKRSPYFEPTFQLYPVGRVMNTIELPTKE
jgi:hypothetical protein